MWILTVIPELAIHLILATGIVGIIAGFVLGFIPIVNKYKLPIQIISLLVFTLGIYLQGGLANNKEWELKVKETDVKVAEAAVKSITKNSEIQEKVVTKIKIVKERGDDIVKYVDKIVTKEVLKEVQGPEREKLIEVIKYVENCPVPQHLIDIHNAATQLNNVTGTNK